MDIGDCTVLLYPLLRGVRMETIALVAIFGLAGMVLAYGWHLATKEITNEEIRKHVT